MKEKELDHASAFEAARARLLTLADTFLQDCDPEIQREATSRTAQQSLADLTREFRDAQRRLQDIDR